MALVNGRRGGPEERFAPGPHPAPRAGSTPQRPALPPSSVRFDAGGQAVVVSDGVVLRVDAGPVSVVAQDDRLRRPFTAEGGLVAYDGGVLLRVDLPARPG